MSLIRIADKVKEAYLELSAKSPDGGVTPLDLVRYAKPVDSPLHKSFTWDNEKAAHNFRIWQARNLLLTMSIEVNEDSDSKGREYQSLQVDENNSQKRRYFDLDTIIRTPKLREQIKRQLISDVKGMLIRYQREKEIYRLINEPELKKLEKQLGHLLKG